MFFLYSQFFCSSRFAKFCSWKCLQLTLTKSLLFGPCRFLCRYNRSLYFGNSENVHIQYTLCKFHKQLSFICRYNIMLCARGTKLHIYWTFLIKKNKQARVVSFSIVHENVLSFIICHYTPFNTRLPKPGIQLNSLQKLPNDA